MVSVLLPVYNQYDELAITLDALTKQDYSEPFEVVIVDDKSTQIKAQIIEQYAFSEQFTLSFYLNSMNKGRAATRNCLIDNSRGDILIFCDADRFPHPSFISDHVRCLKKIECGVSIGKIMEVYESAMSIIKKPEIASISRKAVYYKMIQKLFDDTGNTDSCIAWLAFLSGNLAIYRDTLDAERFDESFREWGFEHFELGYRLFKRGVKIVLNPAAINTHIAHPRKEMEYEKCIRNSYIRFYEKHPDTMIKYLYDFMSGKISLQEYEYVSSGSKAWMEGKKPIYNIII